jgi:hypothetical protein
VALCDTSFYPDTWYDTFKADITANQGYTDFSNTGNSYIIYKQDNNSENRILLARPPLTVEFQESTTGNKTDIKLTNPSGSNAYAYSVGVTNTFSINRRSVYTVSASSSTVVSSNATTQCISSATENVTYNANVSQVFPSEFPYYYGIAPEINYDVCPYDSGINIANELCVPPADPTITPEEFAQYTGISIAILISMGIIWSMRFQKI